MDLGSLLETLEKELKCDDQRFSINNTRKADLLFNIKKELDSFEGDLLKHTKSLENVLLLISSQGCSSPLRRLIKRTLKVLFEKVKSTKAMTFILELLKITQSLKYNTFAKATCLDLIGYFYSEFGSKLVSPPTEEVLESCKKIYKSSDNNSKKFIIKTLNAIIKARPSNLTLISSEYIKFLMKTSTVISI